MTTSTTYSFDTSEIYNINKSTDSNQKDVHSKADCRSMNPYFRGTEYTFETMVNWSINSDSTPLNLKDNHTKKVTKPLSNNTYDLISIHQLLFKRKFPNQKHDPLFEQNILKDKLIFYRENWDNENEFLMSCFGYCFCFESLYHLPYYQYYYGGIWFSLLYFMSLLTIGLPVIVLEIGLGQFTGKGYTNLHHMTPLLKGLGYTKLISLIFVMIKNSVIGSLAYFYLFASFLPHLPWTNCEHYFNSVNCSNITERPIFENHIELSSYEYYENIVINIKDILHFNDYQINLITITPKWHLSMGLLLVWFVTLNLSLTGIKFTGKVLVFTVFYPILSILIILSRISSLPGSINGVNLLFNRPLTKHNLLPSIINAFISAYSSLGLGYSGFITLSSMNNFRDNIYRNSLIIIISVFLGHILFSFTTLCALSHLSYSSNINIDRLLKHGGDYLFVVYPTILANLKFANFWMIIFMITVLTIVTNYLLVCIKICSLELNDLFVKLKEIKHKQPIILTIYTTILILISLVFVSPIGKIIYNFIHSPHDKILIPCLIFIPIFWMSITYGYKQLQSDFKIMSFYEIGPIPFISICFGVPIIVGLIIIYNIYTLQPENELDDNRLFINFIGISLNLLFILPITNGIIIEMINIRISNLSIQFKEYLGLLIQPKLNWGPRLKLYWIHNTKYALKLPEFDNTLSSQSFEYAKRKKLLQTIILNDMLENIEDVTEFMHCLRQNLEYDKGNTLETRSTCVLKNLEKNTLKQLNKNKKWKIENNMKIKINKYRNNLIDKSLIILSRNMPDIVIDILLRKISFYLFEENKNKLL